MSEDAAPEIAPPPTSRFCRACGAENVSGYGFCERCGTPAGEYVVPASATVGVPMGAAAPGGLATFFKTKGAAAALVGAAVGIAFILLAALLVRPNYIGLGNTAQLGSTYAAQVREIQSVVDRIVSVPFLATNLNLPAMTVKAQFSAAGASGDGTLDIQTPVTKWTGLGVLAILIASLCSVVLGKPATARAAVLQGVASCVPYALGVMVIAAVAAMPITLDLASLGVPAEYAAGSSVALSYSFQYLPLFAYILVAGIAVGSLIGLLYATFTSRRPFGTVLGELRIPFAAPTAATAVVLAVAILLSFPATAAIWEHLKTEIPSQALSTLSTAQALSALDDAVLTESPSLALYAYSFGHGVPLTARFSGGVSGLGAPSTPLDGVVRASIIGVSGQEKTAGLMPAAPKYEWWVYLLVLLPVVPLTVGGYLSAAWSNGARSLSLEGAKIAIPYTLAMLALAWLSTLALRMSASVGSLGSGHLELAFGSDLLFTAVLSLVWAGTFGALGGWIRQQRSIG